MNARSMNILLVDDDVFFAQIVSEQIKEEFHHNVVVANSGFRAKEILENGNHKFDIILVDYYMPGMNGIELLQWINSMKIKTPVVILTAAGSDVVAVEAMKLGAYDYVRKEQLDLHHLGVVINATYERYQFRIAQELEEERALEIKLNKIATDKVHEVLNKLTPAINSAIANIHADIETKGDELCNSLPEDIGAKFRGLFGQIQHEIMILEMAIRSLFELYKMLYAHHAESEELERLKKEIDEKVSQS